MLAEAHVQAVQVAAKLPDAVELLRPLESAIAASILGKLGALAAAQMPAATPIAAAA